MPQVSPPQTISAVGQQLTFQNPVGSPVTNPATLVVFNKSPYELEMLGYLIPAWSIIPFNVAAILGGASTVIITAQFLATGVTATSVATVYAAWFAANEQVPDQQAFIADSIIAAISGTIETVSVSNSQAILLAGNLPTASGSHSFSAVTSCAGATQLVLQINSNSNGHEDFTLQFFEDAAATQPVAGELISRALNPSIPGVYPFPVLAPYFRVRYDNATGGSATGTFTVYGYSTPTPILPRMFAPSGIAASNLPIDNQAGVVPGSGSLTLAPGYGFTGKAKLTMILVGDVTFSHMVWQLQAWNGASWDIIFDSLQVIPGTPVGSSGAYVEVVIPMADYQIQMFNQTAGNLTTITTLTMMDS